MTLHIAMDGRAWVDCHWRVKVSEWVSRVRGRVILVVEGPHRRCPPVGQESRPESAREQQ